MGTARQWNVRTQALAALVAAIAIWAALCVAVRAADIDAFVGTYTGSAEITGNDGALVTRDMSVTISETKKGFRVEWTTATKRTDGSSKAKAYAIDFVPSDRGGVYSAAMQRNVFGKEVPLNPMKGEPYVWGRILGDKMTVYSLFVTAEGGYELQQFDRTLTEGGLDLSFQNVSDGEIGRQVSTFLTRQ